MKKRTNSVISSLYQPIGNSRFKTAACMFTGGTVLLCLGVGLVLTTSLAQPRPGLTPVDQTSVLISGPTCIALGLAVAAISGADMCRYRRARNSVESELNRVMGMAGKQQQQPEQQLASVAPPGGNQPKISIIINKPTSLWPT